MEGDFNHIIQYCVKEHDFDFVFYCDSLPLHHPPSSIPHGCIVWDVGHRDYPILNEVTRQNNSNEFVVRDANYSNLPSSSIISVGSSILKDKL